MWMLGISDQYVHSKITHVSYDDQQSLITQAHFDVTKGKHDEIEEDYKQEEEVLEEGGQV
jgi:hypothetical protein